MEINNAIFKLTYSLQISVGTERFIGAILADLLQAYGCNHHDLLIVKKFV